MRFVGKDQKAYITHHTFYQQIFQANGPNLILI